MPHVCGQILHVGADGEIGVIGGGEDGCAIIAVAEAEPGGAEFVTELVVQGILAGGAVHGDGCDVAWLS